MDKISIVVAVYNAEKTLGKCVESLLNQTYKNIEIILVNDCSIDNSLFICEEYAAKYECVTVVNSLSNQGVSATRNNGIDIASGKYICFVDSDDYVENNYVERLYYYAEKYNTVPICGFVYHDEYNRKEPVEYQWSGGDELVSLGEAFRLNQELYLTALWNKLFLLYPILNNRIRFCTEVSIGEDLRFTIDYFQICCLDKVYCFNEKLYHYTKLTNSNLFAGFSNDTKNGFKNLELVYKLAKTHNPNAENEYSDAKQTLRNNYIYHIIKEKKPSVLKKMKMIKCLASNFSILDYFCWYLRIQKEKLSKFMK